jgi:hypothetical protein
MVDVSGNKRTLRGNSCSVVAILNAFRTFDAAQDGTAKFV